MLWPCTETLLTSHLMKAQLSFYRFCLRISGCLQAVHLSAQVPPIVKMAGDYVSSIVCLFVETPLHPQGIPENALLVDSIFLKWLYRFCCAISRPTDRVQHVMQTTFMEYRRIGEWNSLYNLSCNLYKISWRRFLFFSRNFTRPSI